MSADNATIIKDYQNFNDYISDNEVLKAQEFIYEPDFVEKNNIKAREKEAAKGIIMTIISQFKPGMDVTRFQAPIFLLKPISFLEATSDYVCPHSFMVKIAKEQSPEKRIMSVARWILSNCAKTPQKGFNRMKPYNPVLGEQFNCKWDHDDSTTYFYSEQVSHHPPISAIFMENRKYNWYYTSTTLPKATFWGNKADTIIEGEHILHVNDFQEKYVLTWPNMVARGILLGSSCVELNNSVVVKCEKTGLEVKIDFKKKKNNEVEGFLTNVSTNTQIYKITGHIEGKVNVTDLKTKQSFVWIDGKAIPKLTKILSPVSEQQHFESRRVWHHVTNSIVNFNYDMAGKLKNLVEDHQRAITKNRKEKNEVWKNLEFTLTNRKTAEGIPIYEFNKLASPSSSSAHDEREAIADLD